MKKIIPFMLTMILVMSIYGTAGAAFFSSQPDDPDLHDLDHNYYYTWSIDDWDIPEGDTITSASLFFDNIRNWTWDENDLYVHLLDATIDSIGYDRSGGGDYFEGMGILINHWEDLPPYPQDITYTFDVAELSTLNAYYANEGNFGFGFDPDCHFYNDGITFSVNTAPVPEPATMTLFGLGLIGLAHIGRRGLVR